MANKHYWQVTDADFAKAAEGGGGAQAAQNAAQLAHAQGGMEPQATKAAHEKTPVLLGSAEFCDTVQNRGVGDTGLEPVTPCLSSTCSNQLS